MNLEKLKLEYEELESPFPIDGKQARGSMLCFLDSQGSNNIIGDGKLNPATVRKYEIARELAIHYGTDVSDYPVQLTKDEKGRAITIIG